MVERVKDLIGLVKLNSRVLSLAACNKWLSTADVAASYDCLASQYDSHWLVQIQPVTNSLLAKLPQSRHDHIVELGCGTGYVTKFLSTTFPGSRISAVDVSANMLAEARRKIQSKNTTLIQADMLEYLFRCPSASASMIISAWAIGYSRFDRIFREASRVLRSDGILAFIVNYRDTLKPVFQAYRRCMVQFPHAVRKAALLHFPSSYHAVEKQLQRNGFRVIWHEDGRHPIRPREPEVASLSWLLRTGVLAGFDIMLPLKDGGPLADQFDKMVRASENSIDHHYLAVIANLE